MQPGGLQELCVGVITRLVGAGTVVAATELVYLRREFSAQGLFNWGCARTRFPRAIRQGTIVLLDAVCDGPRFLCLVWLQALCGVLLLFDVPSGHRELLLPAILLTHLVTMLRSSGTDGADQMQTILLAALVCYYATPDPVVRKAAVWFLALQTMLAYVTAGVSKFWSEPWRKGTMLHASVVRGLGSETFDRWRPKGELTNKLLCWAVIALECGFPLGVVRPAFCFVIVGAGVALHVTNAFALGLPRFLFTFVAAYPAIVSVTFDVQPALKAHLW